MAEFIGCLISVGLCLSLVPVLQWMERHPLNLFDQPSECCSESCDEHAERDPRAANVVVLDPDVAERFPDSESVNRALRALAATNCEHDPAG